MQSHSLAPIILAASAAMGIACGSDHSEASREDGGVDVSDVSGDTRDARVTCARPLPELPPEEWRHLDELDPCAAAYVSRDPAKSAPAWRWVPCRNGAANCQELEANWRSDFPAYFGGAWASRDAEGLMDRVLIMRLFDNDAPFGSIGWEEDLYDSRTGRPLAATRSLGDQTPLYVDLGTNALTLESFWNNDVNRRAFFHGSANGTELSGGAPLPYTHQTDARLGACLNLPQVISSTTWGCSDPARRVVGRMNIATGTLVTQTAPRPLHLITVEGSDVYFRESRNDAGWERVHRFDADASLHTLRDPSARHVSSFATDGKVLAWLEAFGDPSPSGGTPQPSLELWAAPYTNNDTTLNASAKRVAVLERSEYKSNVPGTQGVMFGGTYAAATGPTTIQVVRLSDGRTKILRNVTGANRTIFQLVAVSESEAWIVTMREGTNQSDALVRVALGGW
jgi:hypothetical protein